MDLIGIIMSAGKASVNVALYTLIPIMVVMLIIMRYLENRGILDRIVHLMTPLLRPFGVTGMAIFALIQLNFVSFAAPLAALAVMEKRGISDRHIAAALAMLFAMGQGNVFYPLIPYGLHMGAAVAISIVGGLCASALTWHVVGRKLSSATLARDEDELMQEKSNTGLIAIINGAGADAIRLSLGSVPMLILSLTVVGILTQAGAIDALTRALTPLLNWLTIPTVFVLPALTKCLAGGTAYFGVLSDLIHKGMVNVHQINASAGLLIQTFDLPGVGIFLGLAPRFVRLFRFVIPGVIVGIALRAALHMWIF